MGTTVKEIDKLLHQLFPVCRSITGDGVRQTLQQVNKMVPVDIHEVESGTKVFDWTVPNEWEIRDAYIKNSLGQKIVDFKKSNLHVLGYSTGVNRKMTLAELRPHLYSLPDYPDWIPYLTSYYKENWGFCLTDHQLQSLKNDTYEVVIDAKHKSGSLTYGEFYLPGKSKDEVLVSTYLCHPSLANDNLSGVVLSVFLAKALQKSKNRYSYRFLFIPETIGAITWLGQNKDILKNIKYGLVATCVGDPGKLTYKKSRYGDAEIDKASEKVLVDSEEDYKIIDFFPSGSDERQYCSPGINLPVGSLMRTPYGQFPEYHTSADNLDFVKPAKLADTLAKYLEIIFVMENNKSYQNQNPCCEPQLGRRGLYSIIGGQKDSNENIDELAIFWVLNLSDGQNSLLDIAIRSGMKFRQIYNAAKALEKKKLLNYWKKYDQREKSIATGTRGE